MRKVLASAAVTSLLAGLALAAATTASAATITTSGHQLLIDGAPLVVRGVNYSPTPNTGVRAAGGGDFTAAPAVCAADFAPMREMGANAVRVYVSYEALFNNYNNHDPTSDAVVPAALDRYRQVLASAQAEGLWIIVNYWVPQNINYDQAQPRQWQKIRFQKIVHTFKDAGAFPNVLLWAFGNENNLASHLAGMTSADMFSFYQEAISESKATEDTGHPYTVVLVDNGDMANASLLGLASSVDLWAMTLYQTAAGYERIVRTYAGAKPLLLMEFGQDAYAAGESQATQAAFYGDRWGNHIAPHLSARDAAQVLLGGCIFEWNDEWWKAGNATVHDPGGSAGNDDADNVLDEEWFGISTALPDGVAGPRSYRQAFDVLRTLWTATDDARPPVADGGGPSSVDGGNGGGSMGAGGGISGGGAGLSGTAGAMAGAAAGQIGATTGAGGDMSAGAASADAPSDGTCGCALGRPASILSVWRGGAWAALLLPLLTRAGRRKRNASIASKRRRNRTTTGRTRMIPRRRSRR